MFTTALGMKSVFHGFETLNIMKDKLNRLDTILHELQLDEYLNEDSLPKIGEARGLVTELVKNCSITVVVGQSEQFPSQICYKTNAQCKYNCKGLCKES